MRKQRERRALGSQTLVFALCLAVFCALLALVFNWYRARLDGEFNVLVQENLTAYAEGQHREVQAAINDVEGTLKAVAAMLEASDVDPDSRWLTSYLEQLGETRADYAITYLSMTDLRQRLEGPGIIQADWETYEALRRGEEVVSDVRLSKRMGDHYYFSIAVPVWREGEVVGALRSLLAADKLVQTVQTGYFRDSVASYIFRQDGGLVPVRDAEIGLEANVLEYLTAHAAEPGAVERVRRGLEEDGSGTYRVELDSGRAVFISTSYLGYNGWHIVNFTLADEVSNHSRSILYHTVLACGAVVVLTVGAGGFLLWQFRRQRRALDRARDRYAILAKFSDTVLMEYDYAADIARFSPNASALLGLTQLRIDRFAAGGGFAELLHPEDREAARDLAGFKPPSGEQGSRELRIRGADGDYFWCVFQYQAVYDDRGQASLLLCKLVDITQQKERELGLIARSETDALTGLYNKAAVVRRVERCLQEGARGFLLMVDIDDFKQINDRLGHQAGDRVISHIGGVIRSVFRDGDLLGRVGGDEFVAFMPGCTDRTAAQRKAELLLERITALGRDGEGGPGLSCSIGMAECPGDGTDFQSLYRAADRAMYEAKKGGKHTSRFAEKA